jgi:hypothetical protein
MKGARTTRSCVGGRGLSERSRAIAGALRDIAFWNVNVRGSTGSRSVATCFTQQASGSPVSDQNADAAPVPEPSGPSIRRSVVTWRGVRRFGVGSVPVRPCQIVRPESGPFCARIHRASHCDLGAHHANSVAKVDVATEIERAFCHWQPGLRSNEMSSGNGPERRIETTAEHQFADAASLALLSLVPVWMPVPWPDQEAPTRFSLVRNSRGENWEISSARLTVAGSGASKTRTKPPITAEGLLGPAWFSAFRWSSGGSTTTTATPTVVVEDTDVSMSSDSISEEDLLAVARTLRLTTGQ